VSRRALHTSSRSSVRIAQRSRSPTGETRLWHSGGAGPRTPTARRQGMRVASSTGWTSSSGPRVVRGIWTRSSRLGPEAFAMLCLLA
jgi:hypothetical protein